MKIIILSLLILVKANAADTYDRYLDYTNHQGAKLSLHINQIDKTVSIANVSEYVAPQVSIENASQIASRCDDLKKKLNYEQGVTNSDLAIEFATVRFTLLPDIQKDRSGIEEAVARELKISRAALLKTYYISLDYHFDPEVIQAEFYLTNASITRRAVEKSLLAKNPSQTIEALALNTDGLVSTFQGQLAKNITTSYRADAKNSVVTRLNYLPLLCDLEQRKFEMSLYVGVITPIKIFGGGPINEQVSERILSDWKSLAANVLFARDSSLIKTLLMGLALGREMQSNADLKINEKNIQEVVRVVAAPNDNTGDAVYLRAINSAVMPERLHNQLHPITIKFGSYQGER